MERILKLCRAIDTVKMLSQTTFLPAGVIERALTASNADRSASANLRSDNTLGNNKRLAHSPTERWKSPIASRWCLQLTRLRTRRRHHPEQFIFEADTLELVANRSPTVRKFNCLERVSY